MISQGISNARIAIQQDHNGNMVEALKYYDLTIQLLQQGRLLRFFVFSRRLSHGGLFALCSDQLRPGSDVARRDDRQVDAVPGPQGAAEA